ncbi:hypothetical protein LDENG_00206550, partial [Lucifuga dentata]
FKALHSQAPIYIFDLLTPYKPERCLRSSGRNLLIVPESQLVTKSDRAFVCAPKLWNSLLEDLRLVKLVSSFWLGYQTMLMDNLPVLTFSYKLRVF